MNALYKIMRFTLINEWLTIVALLTYCACSVLLVAFYCQGQGFRWLSLAGKVRFGHVYFSHWP